MKRLMALTVLVALVTATAGCRSCRTWFRGTFLDPEPETVICDPCAPMVTQPGACAPCTGAPATAPATPGPGSYVPMN